MATKKAPSPSSPDYLPHLASRFHALFTGLDRAYGAYTVDGKRRKATKGGAKVEGKARTVQAPVTTELWEQHLVGDQGIGIVPINDDAMTSFGAIDIDTYNLDIAEVEAKCAALRLPLLPTRTKSGGIHLYLFTDGTTTAELVKSRLEEWSIALGHGGCEIFPKQKALLSSKDTGNWINMPYFGIALGTTDRYAVHKGKPLDAESFLLRAERLTVGAEVLEALALPDVAEFTHGPPCLQSLARSGFPEGMRNNGLFAVGVYLKKRFPDDWAAHIAAYNAKFFKPPLAEPELKNTIKTLGRKDYNYTCDKPPIKNFCNRSLCRTREFGVGKGDADWGIVIDSDAQKVLTDPPYWIMTVNGTRMQFFADELMMQRHFQQSCFEKLGVWPPALPSDKWRAEVNKMLASASEVDAPTDSGSGGELAYHLHQFVTVFPRAETREEVLTGKPYTEDGNVHFRAADFKRYLESNHFRALTGTRLYQRARALGVMHKQLWVAGTSVQVWVVPAPPAVDVEAVKGRRAKEGEM